MARFEKAELNTAIVDFCEKTNFAWIYLPLNQSAAETQHFIRNMNKLLKWADIPILNAKELLL